MSEAAEQMIANLLDKGARSRHQAVYEARDVYAQLIAMAVARGYEVLPENVDGWRYCQAEYHKCLGLPARAGR